LDKTIPGPASETGAAVAGSRLIQLGLLCGLVAPLLWVTVIGLAGALRPGFDHVSQYISELGERGSATAAFIRYAGFVATGCLHVGYAAAFHAAMVRIVDHRRLTLLVAVLIGLNGIGRIGAGIFSCEPGCVGPDVLAQRLHGWSATLAFLSIAGAAMLAAILLRTEPRWRALADYSFASGSAGLIFLWMMSSSESTHAFVGLYERLASGVLTLWVFVTAWQLWRFGSNHRRQATP
jgi:hypothetical membrane protein